MSIKPEVPVYLVIKHERKIDKNSINGKYKLVEKVFLTDNLTKYRKETANLIIDVKNGTFLKSKSEFNNVGKNLVANVYISDYLTQIKKFYNEQFNVDFGNYYDKN